jgi:hypothetical protein
MDITTLEQMTLPDHLGEPYRLGDLWEDKSIVLVFLRHFG